VDGFDYECEINEEIALLSGLFSHAVKNQPIFSGRLLLDQKSFGL
jgi:hypothetical protein